MFPILVLDITNHDLILPKFDEMLIKIVQDLIIMQIVILTGDSDLKLSVD